MLGAKVDGVHESFFDLGGHSLRAQQVAGLIRRQIGIECPVTLPLTHPTMARLVEAIRELPGERPEPRE